jgi:hypothetical protein
LQAESLLEVYSQLGLVEKIPAEEKAELERAVAAYKAM